MGQHYVSTLEILTRLVREFQRETFVGDPDQVLDEVSPEDFRRYVWFKIDTSKLGISSGKQLEERFG
jgi:hypothetical protein